MGKWASWFDNLSSGYKRFANSLNYELTDLLTGDGSWQTNLNNQLSEQVEAWRKSVFATEGENRGLDLQEMQDYADYLASIAGDTDALTEANDELADSLVEDSDAALLVARSVMSMNKGIATLSKNIKT